ncbi:hypothetical protein [Gordonia sp. NPDC003950]
MKVPVEGVEVAGRERGVETIHPRTVVEPPVLDGDADGESDPLVQGREVAEPTRGRTAQAMTPSRATTSSMVVTAGIGSGGATTAGQVGMIIRCGCPNAHPPNGRSGARPG